MLSHNEKPCYPSTWAIDLIASNVLLFLAANSVGQIQDKEKGFWTTGFHYSLPIPNVLLHSIVFHRKVIPSWVHLSNIVGPRFVRTKFPPSPKQDSETSPFRLFHSPAFTPPAELKQASNMLGWEIPPLWRKIPRTPMPHGCLFSRRSNNTKGKSWWAFLRPSNFAAKPTKWRTI